MGGLQLSIKSYKNKTQEKIKEDVIKLIIS
jgi:hypothetical protein